MLHLTYMYIWPIFFVRLTSLYLLAAKLVILTWIVRSCNFIKFSFYQMKCMTPFHFIKPSLLKVIRGGSLINVMQVFLLSFTHVNPASELSWSCDNSHVINNVLKADFAVILWAILCIYSTFVVSRLCNILKVKFMKQERHFLGEIKRQ